MVPGGSRRSKNEVCSVCFKEKAKASCRDLDLGKGPVRTCSGCRTNHSREVASFPAVSEAAGKLATSPECFPASRCMADASTQTAVANYTVNQPALSPDAAGSSNMTEEKIVSGGLKTDNDLRRQLKSDKQKRGRFDAKLRNIIANTTLSLIEVHTQVQTLLDTCTDKMRADDMLSCKYIDPDDSLQ
jgi:hypothetical protein